MPDVRPINANSLIEKLNDWRVELEDVDMNNAYDVGCYATIGKAIMISENAPVLDYAPVRHGEWEYRMGSYSMPNCSRCGWRIPYSEDSELDARNFCPNCGAIMDGGKENV